MKNVTPNSNMSETEIMAVHVTWYREHGKHRDRITRIRTYPGIEYVIGDWSWNRLNPSRLEYVDAAMNAHLENQPTTP